MREWFLFFCFFTRVVEKKNKKKTEVLMEKFDEQIIPTRFLEKWPKDGKTLTEFNPTIPEINSINKTIYGC